MGVEQAAAIGPRLACGDAVKATAAIARHVQAGGQIAASCSSVALPLPGAGSAVSRMLLIDGRQAQTPFIMPEIFASGDDVVARLAVRIGKSLPDSQTVAELAQEFCMSERTLSRHLQRVTGRTTLALIQSVKLRRARALLESTRMTVEQVAEAVGYQDSTALRRMMKRVAGANPSRYRPAIVVA
ncbi:helix-turn-helix domain-containing protein [Cupriavidus sp. YR651]|uniref:helix-turn-helix domain-containing protein n=1 Tax=Cupriavidus sp. YR651 TaxID=1855315 RepID=UPI0021008434|nr:AraC family transcriptional regulator [Cupriavidus sp. YR651]